MKIRISVFLGRLLLGLGSTATLALLLATWNHQGSFRETCHKAVGEWTSWVTNPDGSMRKAQPPAPVSGESGVREYKPEEVLVLADRAGRPLSKMPAAMVYMKPYGEAASFRLSEKMEPLLYAAQLNWESIVVIIGLCVTSALIGFVLLTASRVRRRFLVPLFLGSAPLAGFAISYANYYLLYEGPWTAFTSMYYIEANPGFYGLGLTASWGLLLGAILATVSWAAQSFSKDTILADNFVGQPSWEESTAANPRAQKLPLAFKLLVCSMCLLLVNYFVYLSGVVLLGAVCGAVAFCSFFLVMLCKGRLWALWVLRLVFALYMAAVVIGLFNCVVSLRMPLPMEVYNGLLFTAIFLQLFNPRLRDWCVGQRAPSADKVSGPMRQA